MTASASTTLDTHVCTVCGEVDIRTAPAFREALMGSLRVGESTHVDLRAVTFFGVAGIEVLIEARDLADRQHSVLCIEGSACVIRVLERLGLSGEFNICA